MSLPDIANGLYDPRTFGAKRSPKWIVVRRNHLLTHPTCAACGRRDNLEVHHLKPFHLHPELELDPANLLTLCEGATQCHFVFGHFGNWALYNPEAVPQTALYLKRKHEAQNAGISPDGN